MTTIASHMWLPSGARRVLLDGFTPVPRGTLPATPVPLVWPAKDPADVLDYEFDISAALLANTGDGIVSIDVQVTPNATGDLALASATANGPVAVMWFGAGQTGTVYTVQIGIGTTGGRTINRAVLLPVQSFATPAIPTRALTTNTGAIVTDQSGNPILIGS